MMAFNEGRVRKDLKRRLGGRGHSKKLRTRNRDPEGEAVIRIYVEEKIPLEELSSRELVPNEIDGIPTDVERVGLPRAASLRDRHRPLICGCSIGNFDITYGTQGYYFEKISSPSEVLLGSNAHVFSDTIRPMVFQRKIMQPGKKHGGSPRDIVAHLVEHTPLWRPLNPFNALWMVLVNLICQAVGQDPPYDLTDSEPRYVDFAVASPMVALSWEVAGLESYDKFLGLFFAASNYRSWFCKARYIEEFGYRPVGVDVDVCLEGDLVCKGGGARTEAPARGEVLDDSMFLWVDYGGWGNLRPLDDVVMTEKMISGGDSGTAVWKEAVFG